MKFNCKLIVILSFIGILSDAYALPDIKTWTTTNGMKVFFVESTELPMIDLALTFDAGSARDGKLAGFINNDA